MTPPRLHVDGGNGPIQATVKAHVDCVRSVYLALWCWWTGFCPGACPGPDLLWDEEAEDGWTDGVPGFHGFN